MAERQISPWEDAATAEGAVSVEVTVARCDSGWSGELPALSGARTTARNLSRLRVQVDDLVRIVLDLGRETQVDQDWQWPGLEDELLEAAGLGAEQRAAERAQAELARRAEQTVCELLRRGVPALDIAGLLAIPPHRVNSIARASRR